MCSIILNVQSSSKGRDCSKLATKKLAFSCTLICFLKQLLGLNLKAHVHPAALPACVFVLKRFDSFVKDAVF